LLGKSISPLFNNTKITEMTIVRSRSHASDQLQTILNKFKEIKISGSSIKGCIIAKGEADTYIRLGPTNEWDICAMNAIITEANGIMTDLKGNPLKYNQNNTLNQGFIVSNNKIHEQLIKLINNKNEQT
jgi:3'(2'), 5'-bisphosphate nucleotidase